MIMSRILNRQRQLAEQGRLRLGYTAPGKNGKPRPVRSTTWVVTSHSKEHVETAARLWGGAVEEWQPQGNGASPWRVITEADTIDAILPPGDPLSQAYELWNRGGCVRRCDGVTELLSGSPCQCFAEHGEYWYTERAGSVCESKSRLKVLLPDMPGLGSWRMETGSYYATDEVAGTVDTIRAAVGESALVPVRLRIEPRTRTSGGQTRQFVVPVLDLRGVTSGALLAGQGQVSQGQLLAAAGGGGVAELDAAPAQPEATDWHTAAEGAQSLDEVRWLWQRAAEEGSLDEELRSHLTGVAGRFTGPQGHPQPESEEGEPPAEPGPEPEGDSSPGPDTAPAPDAGAVWQRIVAAAGERGMDADAMRALVLEATGGVEPEDCDGWKLADALARIEQQEATA